MCQCLLSSSVDSPSTTGSYKHAQIQQPFGFTSCLHLAPEWLRRKPRMLGERKGCMFLDPALHLSGAPGLAIIMGAHPGALKGWSWGVGVCLRNWPLILWRAGFEFWLFQLLVLCPKSLRWQLWALVSFTDGGASGLELEGRSTFFFSFGFTTWLAGS